ncbi:ATPase [Caloramator sp. E03]|uniref:ATPase n=1 Tax=Caloramator sp. E03 TaxID=2576307 RepID=UPI00111060E5|nr:ATPase [Caloramator sp. E03]QCX33013.1 ATPase [Caloramator sp. E03]
MAFEIVKQITQIEEEGDRLIKEAQNNALEIQKRAKEEAKQIIDRAKSEAENYYNSVIQKYEKDAQKDVQAILNENDKVIKELNEISKDRLNKAVNLVIERIVNSHGNS